MDVVILIGSESDFEIVKDAVEILKKFGVSHALEITSAHRSPKRTVDLVRRFETEGAEVFIAVAGKAAHLGGVVAAHTTRPVIGVPVESGGLLSTVQMPRGIPVATMGTGKTGAVNAALLAVQILGLKKPALREKFAEYKRTMAAQVEADSEKLKKSL